MDATYLHIAAALAEDAYGASSPNPPVGACIVADGKILGLGAHRKAGQDHAEILALKNAIAEGHAAELRDATIYVTLEPCNHFGKTPPCVRALKEAGIRRVVYGVEDPNPTVKGGGAAELRAGGIETINASSLGIPDHRFRSLLRGFRSRVLNGRPWVVHKVAYRQSEDGRLTMLPPRGASTFASFESLRLAHELRKRSDAILTTCATIFADYPRFDVRHVADIPQKRRTISVISRSNAEFPAGWLERAGELGFEVVVSSSVEQGLSALAQAGANQVLVEAGPRFSKMLEASPFWDERVEIVRFAAAEAKDSVWVKTRESEEHVLGNR